MIYVNIPEAEYKAVEKSKVRNGVQYYFARFNAVTTDGITHAVECELDHKPNATEIASLQTQFYARTRHYKLIGVEGFAKSDAVKSFDVNGNPVWLDSEARASIAKAVADKRAAGRTETTLYLGGTGYKMDLDKADEILRGVEIYASDCYEATENHKAAIAALPDEELEAYDYTSNYPERPSFTL